MTTGIEDGQTLRVGVEGNQEIFVTVRVEDSSYFRCGNLSLDFFLLAFLLTTYSVLASLLFRIRSKRRG